MMPPGARTVRCRTSVFANKSGGLIRRATRKDWGHAITDLRSGGQPRAEGTAYTLRMLYFDCRGKRYYAGQEDLESRHEIKERTNRAT
jgi:hypothetical protein